MSPTPKRDRLWEAQLTFEVSLKNGELVQARWPHKRQHLTCPARVVEVMEGTIAVVLDDDRPGHERGDQLNLPRVHAQAWSRNHTVWPIDASYFERRKCEWEACDKLLPLDAPARRKFCSADCRFKAHEKRGHAVSICGQVTGNPANYHSLKIHKDDVNEFVNRVVTYLAYH